MCDQVERPGPELIGGLLHVICLRPAWVANPHFVSGHQNPAWEALPGSRGHGVPARRLILFHLHRAIAAIAVVIIKLGPSHPWAHSNCPNTQIQTNKEKITLANPL